MAIDLNEFKLTPEKKTSLLDINQFKLKSSTPTEPESKLGGFLTNAYNATKDFATGRAATAFLPMAQNFAKMGSSIAENTVGRVANFITGDKGPLDVSGTRGVLDMDLSTDPNLQPQSTAEKIGGIEGQIEPYFWSMGPVKQVDNFMKSSKVINALSPTTRYITKVGLGALTDATASGVTTFARTLDEGKALKDAAITGLISAPLRSLSLGLKASEKPLEESAKKSMSEALGATTKENKALTERVVPEMLKQKVWFATNRGLAEEAATKIDDLGETLDEAWAAIPKGTKVEISPIVSQIDDAQKGLSFVDEMGRNVVPPQSIEKWKALQTYKQSIIEASRAEVPEQIKNYIAGHIQEGEDVIREVPESVLKNPTNFFSRVKTNIVDGLKFEEADDIANNLDSINIDKFANRVYKGESATSVMSDFSKEVAEKLKEGYITNQVEAQSLRKYRQLLDQTIKLERSGEFGLTGLEKASKFAEKTVANSARNELAKEFPNIDKINKEFNLWSNIMNISASTAQRVASQKGTLANIAETVGAGAAIASGGGLAKTAVMATVFKLTKQLIHSPLWKSVSAIQKYKLSKLVGSMKWEEASRLVTRLLSGSTASR